MKIIVTYLILCAVSVLVITNTNTWSSDHKVGEACVMLNCKNWLASERVNEESGTCSDNKCDVQVLPVSNIRLVNHEDYLVSVIEGTMRKVEEMEWCNLKVNDVTLDLAEDVLGTRIIGKVEYTNGFVVSIQWIDIVRHTVQQIWRFDRNTNTTTVQVRGSMRMHAVTLGFDVLANFGEGEERYTAAFTHPLLTFDFTITKDMKKIDEIDVTVTGIVPRNTNTVRIMPDNKHSQAFGALYDWNSTTVGILSWGTEVFRPIAYKLITTEIEFPRICYNCPVVR